jgi:hypothetical protein
MQKKFVFKKRSISEDADEEKKTLTYTPSDMDEKDIEIKVKDEGLAEQLGLPVGSFGDSVIVEFGAKETQAKLVVKVKKKEDEDDQGVIPGGDVD